MTRKSTLSQEPKDPEDCEELQLMDENNTKWVKEWRKKTKSTHGN